MIDSSRRIVLTTAAAAAAATTAPPVFAQAPQAGAPPGLPAGRFVPDSCSAAKKSIRSPRQRAAGLIPLAVLRLICSSTLVACWIGRSVGFSPLRTRPV